MQDNYSKYEDDMDGQFADHAWEEMAKLLDKELPVVAPVPDSSDKRKYLLLLLLFLLLGTGAGWWMSSQYHEQTTSAESTNQVIVSKTNEQNILEIETSVDGTEEATDVSMKTNGQVQPSSTSTNEVKSEPLHTSDYKATQSTTSQSRDSRIVDWSSQKTTNTVAIKTKESHLGSQAINTENKQDLNAVKPRTTDSSTGEIVPNVLENTPSADKANTESVVQPSNTTSAPSKNKTVLPKALTQPIALLDILDANELETQVAEEDLSTYKIELPKKPYWKPDVKGIELAVHSKSLGSIDGFSIGGLLEYGLRSPRFSIQTGLHYDIIATQGTPISDVLSRNDDLSSPATGGSTGGGAYEDENVVEVIYEDENADGSQSFDNIEQVLLFENYSHLHYISVPLQLNYHPWAALELNAGIKPSYLIGTTFKDTEAIRVAQNDIELLDVNNFKSTSARENNKLRKFDARTYIGATWYPKPSFGLGLRYNLGLSKAFPSLTSNTWRDYRNNSWQLSMVFKFSS